MAAPIWEEAEVTIATMLKIRSEAEEQAMRETGNFEVRQQNERKMNWFGKKIRGWKLPLPTRFSVLVWRITDIASLNSLPEMKNRRYSIPCECYVQSI
jgi:hypothetical protein